jgi:hypothetical protein
MQERLDMPVESEHYEYPFRSSRPLLHPHCRHLSSRKDHSVRLNVRYNEHVRDF